MNGIKGQWNNVTDRARWAARGASFMAKVKATKVVWFPPEPAEPGKAASTAKKATKRATKKTTGAAQKAAH